MALKEVAFEIPESLNASVPPERRGVRRDYVQLMVLDKLTGETEHCKFYELTRFLQKGDLLVLNASRTVPALLTASWVKEGKTMSPHVEVRLAHRLNEWEWEALVVATGVEIGDVLIISASLQARVVRKASGPLMTLCFSLSGSALLDQIYTYGQPVRYEYIAVPWDLEYYQTVFASMPGSVEMPSAGRAFSWELLLKLKRKGVNLAFIQLHTGLSYFLDDQWHQEPVNNYEEYTVPKETVDAILQTKRSGGKVIAVGTTVVRSLETAANQSGSLQASAGWTNLFIDANYSLKIVDGLITGFHEPKTSHLELLSAFIQPELLLKSYQEAIVREYKWHEFGDMNLIL